MTELVDPRIAQTSPELLRVASVPASHVYVRHLAMPGADDGVRRLTDPAPADGRTVPGGWWPPVMLEPNWIARHHDEFDVFHIHFGFDTVAPSVLSGIVTDLRAHGKPLVYTVHDLRNPHQPDPRPHREQLDVLIPAASELITLTEGAANEIARRWGRTATVLPHPHVVPPPRIGAPRPSRDDSGFVVGVHVKSRRANMDPIPVLETLAETVPSLPGATLRIDLHDEVFDPANHWYQPELGRRVLGFGRRAAVDVRVHPYFDDEQLWRYLSSLSVSVLPYRFGTHSGWLEACHDLGTAVIAPSCGFYGEQRRCEVFGFDEHRFDPASLVRALRATYRTLPEATTWSRRRRERRRLALAHRDIYGRALRARQG